MERVKLVVFVPTSHSDQIRKVLGDAGAGKIGNYKYCSFSVKGQGRYLPQEGAQPAIGEAGKLEVVDEERIEVECNRSNLGEIVRKLKEAHPYEEVVFDVYSLLEL